MRNRFLLAIIIFFSVFFGQSCSNQKNTKLENYYWSECKDSFDYASYFEKEWSKVYRACNFLIEENPKHHQGYYARGVAFLRMNKGNLLVPEIGSQIQSDLENSLRYLPKPRLTDKSKERYFTRMAILADVKIQRGKLKNDFCPDLNIALKGTKYLHVTVKNLVESNLEKYCLFQ